ncbi:hypothetical protein IEQ34_003180 [Dendrobium chrysotoxum]|uniref:Uncharacterized protein n=1 Tax=Dendrobium chrysotoxum TaxID=161865 RepID=A0AAV7HGU9_DENCH|nr:hypothetical protein IEQ34_003180 [Dendrobium chrysotoxum]
MVTAGESRMELDGPGEAGKRRREAMAEEIGSESAVAEEIRDRVWEEDGVWVSDSEERGSKRELKDLKTAVEG